MLTLGFKDHCTHHNNIQKTVLLIHFTKTHSHIIHITVDLYTFVLSNNLHSDKQENKNSSGTLLGSSVIPETQQGLDLWGQDNTTGAMSKLNPLHLNSSIVYKAYAITL